MDRRVPHRENGAVREDGETARKYTEADRAEPAVHEDVREARRGGVGHRQPQRARG